MIVTLAKAASGDHATWPDAAFLLALMLGCAAIIWAASRWWR